jgi:undecaprenyl-diphosphatase
VEIGGRTRPVWLLFAGNGRYSSWGPAPVRRRDLADGLLDVRIVGGGNFARTRLLGSALSGLLTRSPAWTAVEVPRLRIRIPGAAATADDDGARGQDGGSRGGGVHLAYDGEVAPAPGELVLDKMPGGLRVYRR